MDLDKFFSNFTLLEADSPKQADDSQGPSEDDLYDPDDTKPSIALKEIGVPLEIRKAFDVVWDAKNINQSLSKFTVTSKTGPVPSLAILVKYFEDVIASKTEFEGKVAQDLMKVLNNVFTQKKVPEDFRSVNHPKIKMALEMSEKKKGEAKTKDEIKAAKAAEAAEKKRKKEEAAVASKKDPVVKAEDIIDNETNVVKVDDVIAGIKYFRNSAARTGGKNALAAFKKGNPLSDAQEVALKHLTAIYNSDDDVSTPLIKEIIGDVSISDAEEDKMKKVFTKLKTRASAANQPAAPKAPETSTPPNDKKTPDTAASPPPSSAQSAAAGTAGTGTSKATQTASTPPPAAAKPVKPATPPPAAEPPKEPEKEDPGSEDEGKPQQITVERRSAKGMSREKIRDMILSKAENTLKLFDEKTKKLQDQGRVGDKAKISSLVRLRKTYEENMRKMAQKAITKGSFDAEMNYTRALYYTDITLNKANLKSLEGKLSRIVRTPGERSKKVLQRGIEKYEAGKKERVTRRKEKFGGDERTRIRKIAEKIVSNVKERKGFIGGAVDLGAEGADLVKKYGSLGKEEIKLAIQKAKRFPEQRMKDRKIARSKAAGQPRASEEEEVQKLRIKRKEEQNRKKLALQTQASSSVSRRREAEEKTRANIKRERDESIAGERERTKRDLGRQLTPREEKAIKRRKIRVPRRSRTTYIK